MSSLVSEFIINPVLRQARRLSEISRPAPPEVTAPVVDDAATTPSAGAARPDDCPSQVTRTLSNRPATASTLSTSVEEPLDVEAGEWGDPPPSLAPSGSPEPTGIAAAGGTLPEDDGMGSLRRRLLSIQSQDIPAADKARFMHETLMEGYRKARQQSKSGDASVPAVLAGEAWEQSLALGPLDALKFWQHTLGEVSPSEKFVLTADDVKPTYAVIDGQPSPAVLGCQHYRRNVKLQCSTCHKWYPCRFCHDSAEDHVLIRKETKNMLCMLCATPQRASEVCVNCGVNAARYYCGICKLWDDHPLKNIYHCNDCGICRRGIGLGKDFFHCKTCCACISISIIDSHKCIERSTDCNCPICGDYMFTSPKPLVFMPCGHSIHRKCYQEHEKTSYKCPICNKSFRNMETQFRNLDAAIQSQPMPAEFQDTKATVLCNDCCAKSTTNYHWLGLKCLICTSYNTVELQVLGGVTPPPPPAPLAALLTGDRSRQDGAARSIAPAQASSRESFSEPLTGARAMRRRHSSAGTESRRASDLRAAWSLSPDTSTENLLRLINRTADDDDSDDDILGFWSRGSGDEAVFSGGEDGDTDGDSDSLPVVDEEDEDSDEEILLIGHR
ncbi:related to Zn-finger protein [Cephalotrichum gorgonifer]|uniref:Related to Zn-finger protein n=1 Tax=Cephalotrichum gorgonifer TaxID=2041049 RepID=A0AAE8N2P8_9PEZI|nr:related to Zn-finger protein [Cephalotrichum gorgonifer]